ncbi:MAG: leucine-rich repeat protein, partial [Prevotellaceae bacterium]|nr:leucine-rich repeat protein [Prevotellaceae bacterium]
MPLCGFLLTGGAASAETAIFSENFENGVGATLEGWTILNGTQTNRWYVGTAAPYGAGKGAYITNDGGTYTYNITATSVVHLYREVTLNTNTVYVLSFMWKCSQGGSYDYLQVSLLDKSATLAAGAQPTSGQGYQQVRQYTGSANATWENATVMLPTVSTDGVKRLIFSWVNDNCCEGPTPIAIDNVSLVEVTRQGAKTVHLTTAGTLQSMDVMGADNLTVTGVIDARDVQYMRDKMFYLTSLDLSGATIAAYTGTEGTVAGNVSYPANEMPAGSFNGRAQKTGFMTLTSVTLPSNLTSIGAQAFRYSGLSGALTLPSSLTYIGDESFSYNAVTSVTIPAGVTYIGTSAFNECRQLEGTLSIPSAVKAIGAMAFRYAKISSLTFAAGAQVGEIGNEAFRECTSLGTLTLPEGVWRIGAFAFYGCTALTAVTLPSTMVTIDAQAFRSCSKLAGVTVSAPSRLVAIGNEAFMGCSALTALPLPEGLSDIGERAFQGSGLVNFRIPVGVTVIRKQTFKECYSLRTLRIPSLVEAIEEYAMERCRALDTVGHGALTPQVINGNVFNDLGKSLSTITLLSPHSAVDKFKAANVWKEFDIVDCGHLLSIRLVPSTSAVGSITPMGNLYDNNTPVNITGTVASGFTFEGYTSGEVTLGTSITLPPFYLTKDTVIVATFSNRKTVAATPCALQDVAGIATATHLTVTGSINACDVKFIRDNIPFLAELDLSGAVIVAYTGTEGTAGSGNISYPADELPAYALQNNRMLSLLKLPNSLVSIGSYAFQGCRSLQSITFPTELKTISTGAFKSSSLKSFTLASPSQLTTIGNEAFYLSKLEGALPLPEGLNAIGNSAFTETKITSVTFPASLTSLGQHSFLQCYELASVTFPVASQLREINQYTFCSCSKLQSLTLAAGLTKIGNDAFAGCVALPAVTIPSTVVSVEQSAFKNCHVLAAATFASPPQLSTIGNEAFRYCRSLAAIELPEMLSAIGNNAFEECSSLVAVEVPTGVTAIRGHTFKKCAKLRKLTIPSTVTTIESYSLEDCFALDTIINRAPKPQGIDENVFCNYKDANNASTYYGKNVRLIVPTSAVSAYTAANVWKNFFGSNNMGEGGGYLLSVRLQPSSSAVGSVNVRSGLYPSGAKTLVATPASVNFSFIQWTAGSAGGAQLGANATLNLTLTKDTVIYAHFANPKTYSGGPCGLKSAAGMASATKLTVTGNINACDLKFMRDNMLFLTELDLSGATIVTYTGTEGTAGSGSITYPANEMPEKALSGKNSLAQVKLPSSITGIGKEALISCENITSITIPKSVAVIKEKAFHNVGRKTSVTLAFETPSSLKRIDEYAFWMTGLVGEVRLPEGLEVMSKSCFEDALMDNTPTGDSMRFVIPTTVKEVGAQSFYKAERLASVTFSQPSQVTNIGELAFYLCEGLRSVTIPASVATIAKQAFEGCISLVAVRFGANSQLSTIGEKAFYGCSGLNGSLTLPEKFKSVGNYAFQYCTKLDTVRFLSSVETIGSSAFHSCTELKVLDFAGSQPSVALSIGSSAFRECTGLHRLTLPEGLRTMGTHAFFGCTALDTLRLPSSLATMSEYAFSGCSKLVSVTFVEPVQLKHINNRIFSNCTSLCAITIPAGITVVDGYVFDGCSSLSSASLPEGLASLGGRAFGGCASLKKITIPSTVQLLAGSTSLDNTGLDTIINLAPQPQTLADNAFAGITRADVTLIVPDSARARYQAANVWKDFTKTTGGGRLLSVKAEPSNEQIGRATAKIGGVAVASGLYPNNTLVALSATAGPEGEFVEWKHLGVNPNATFALTQDTVITAYFKRVITSDVACGLQNMVNMANEVNLTIRGNINACDIAFIRDYMPSVTTLDLSGATIVEYQGTDGTERGMNRLYPAGELPDFAFDGKKMLATVKLPNNLTSIGNNAFRECTSLTAVAIPATVESIGDRAFQDCSGLTSITFAGNAKLRQIGDYAFQRSRIAAVEIPASLTTLGSLAFHLCDNMTRLTFAKPSQLTNISYAAFQDCNKLTTLELPEGITTIDGFAFNFCRSLTEVVIPEGVTSIGERAFRTCPALERITIASTVTSIGNNAFEGCTGLQSASSLITNRALTPQDITGKNVFAGVSTSGVPLHVPSGSRGLYRAADVWKDFSYGSAPTLPSYLLSVRESPVAPSVGSVSAIDGARGDVSGLLDSGTVVRLRATPLPSYTFVEWRASSGAAVGLGVADTLNFTLTRDTVITAHFGGVLTFDPNGGAVNGQPSFSRTIAYGDMVGAMPTPTHSGYTFQGWYRARNGEGGKVEETSVYTMNLSGVVALYAGWQAIPYQITFDKQGGTGSASDINITVGAPVPSLPTLTRSGYTFRGWYTLAGGGGTHITQGITFTNNGNVKLYAKWEATLTLNPTGGAVSITTNPVAYNAPVGALPVPTRTGYTFDGWYTEEGGNGTPYYDTTTYAVSSGNATLYAKWTGNVYSLFFEGEGGAVTPVRKNVVFGDTVKELPTPVLKGYAFGGWWTEPQGAGTRYTEDSVYLVPSDATLHARWTVDTFRILYKNVAGATNPSDTVYTINSGVIFLKPAEKADHKFMGWYDAATDGALVTFIAASSVRDTTLWATWKPLHTVSFYDGNTAYTAYQRSIAHGDTVSKPSPDPTKTGYVFDKWCKEKELNTAWNFATDVVSAATNLYTKWTPATYEITFLGNGGYVGSTSSDDTIQEVTYQSKVGALPAVHRKGYRFAEWNTKSNGSGTTYDANTVYSTTGNIKLYAVWSLVTYNITYEPNGGANDNRNPATYNVNSGGVTLYNATKDGYTFDGWYNNVNSKVTSIAAGDTGNVTLYARWSTTSFTTYSITYALNGGTNDSNNPSSYTVANNIILQPATKIGHAFGGWYTTYDFIGSAVTAIPANSTGDKAFYAQWIIDTFKVAFNTNGGSAVDAQKVTYGGKVT